MDDVRANYSKAANSPAWKLRPGEMYKKTVLRLNLKNVEKVFESPEQLRAYEEASEFEFNKTTAAPAPVVKNIYSESVKQIEAKTVETVPTETQAVIEADSVPVETQKQEQEFYCESCGKSISWAENTYSNKHFKKSLCRACQANEKGDK